MHQRAAAKTDHNAVNEGAVCPFCALLCNDLKVAVKGERIAVRKPACPRAKEGFDKIRRDGSPKVDGKTASLEDAIGRAAAILRASRQPLIAGLGTDIDGLRAAHRLAAASGAILDHMHSESARSSLAVLQSLGWYATTFSEVRNRADVVLIVGADCRTQYPRFVETCLEPGRALVNSARRSRKVIYIGPKKSAPQSNKLPIENLPCNPANFPEVLSALRACVLGTPLDGPSFGGVSSKRLAQLAATLRAANYAALVFSPGHFDALDARFCIETLSRLTGDLNQTTRAAGLSLSGDDGGASAASVSSWLTGFPLGVSYANKTLSADPARNRSARLIKAGELDALLWVDAFGAKPPPKIGSELPLIVVGHPGLTGGRRAAAAIPVGLPGVHHDARLTRADGVVTMPLSTLQPSELPSVREVLLRLAEAL